MPVNLKTKIIQPEEHRKNTLKMNLKEQSHSDSLIPNLVKGIIIHIQEVHSQIDENQR